MQIDWKRVEQTVSLSLAEDVGTGDVTTASIMPAGMEMEGHIAAKQEGVAAGFDIAAEVFRQLDPRAVFTPLAAEGDRVPPGRIIATLRGPARALLTGERTALNFMGRMSGIATLTRAYVDQVQGTRAVILDTRKTVPGLRMLDKLAVFRGGGRNHRFGLYDMILIKDNHIDCAGSITEAVRRARQAPGGLEIEVETRNLQEVAETLDLGIRRILLDNMEPDRLRAAVCLRDEFVARHPGKEILLEASGNVTLETVAVIAATGVDFISVGALTHSPRVLDLSMRWTSNPAGETHE